MAKTYDSLGNYGIIIKRVDASTSFHLPEQNDPADASVNTNDGALVYVNGTGVNPEGIYAKVGGTYELISGDHGNLYGNGGNAFGANATIGLTDAYSLSILTNNTAQLIIDAAGDVSITNDLEVSGTTTSGKLVLNSPVDTGSPDAALKIARTINDATTNAGHAFKITDSFTRDGTGGYAAVDCEYTINGTANDHTTAFQTRYVINEGGTMDNAYTLWSKNTLNTGTVTDWRHIELYDVQGAGTVVNDVGLYLHNITKGTTTNYSIYSEGGKMYHVGIISTSGDVSIGKGNVTPSATLDVGGNILFSDDLTSASGYFDYDEGLESLGLGNVPNSAYSVYANKGMRVDGAILQGKSSGSYNVMYINGSGGNFGTIQRTATNIWSLGWDTNIGDTRLGTNVINWTSNSRVGIGNGLTNPTAILHLKAGTATASTAPLKLASGTNLTTPEAGAIEYDGTNLFQTNSTTVRGKIEINRSSTSAAGTLALTTTYNRFIFSGTTATWTLPLPSSNNDAKIYIVNKGSSNLTINVSGGGSTIYDSGSNVSSKVISAGSNFIFWSDGTDWIIH